MSKLEFKDGSYFITKKKRFTENKISRDLLVKSLEFAFEMSFGKGYHRNHRSGGSTKRTEVEIFCNALQGKLAEFVLHDILTTKGIQCSEIDTGIYEKGIWDNGDLTANGKKVCVKSAAFFSNLLLLEAKDWNFGGTYLSDTENQMQYDFFVLVRIKPNIKEVFGNISNDLELIKEISDTENFVFDMAGCISKNTLDYIIKNNYLIKKGESINKTEMDAENYYIQAGEMLSLDTLLKNLK